MGTMDEYKAECNNLRLAGFRKILESVDRQLNSVTLWERHGVHVVTVWHNGSEQWELFESSSHNADQFLATII